jgi:hypothetical protein
MLQTRPLPLHGLLHQAGAHPIAQGIAQHGGQALHLELELKG